MSCELLLWNDIHERYIRGELDPPLLDAFEDHFFACASCSEALELHGLLKNELARAVPLPRTKGRHRRSRLLWLGAGGMAAALMILGIGFWTGHPTSPATLTELAVFAPPRYAPPTLRGAQDHSATLFRQAMAGYNEGDYGAAVEGLSRAAKLSPSAPNIRFFLGISLLMARRTDDGIAALNETISMGESAYLEPAHFYLARGHLIRGDARAARAELETVSGMNGDMRAEAERLLQQLGAP